MYVYSSDAINPLETNPPLYRPVRLKTTTKERKLKMGRVVWGNMLCSFQSFANFLL